MVQTVCVAEETTELLALAEDACEVAGVVGWTDLVAPGVGDELARVREGPGGRWLAGIRHQLQDVADPGWLRRPEVRRGLRAVGEASLVYDFVVRHHQLPVVKETVAALCDVRFVLDHAGKPPVASGALSPWREQLRALGRSDNLAVKLSGLVSEADLGSWSVEDLRPYVEVVLDVFGPNRTMWGSDWPVCLLAARYEEWLFAAIELTAGLSAGEREAVFGGTAAEWYSLER